MSLSRRFASSQGASPRDLHGAASRLKVEAPSADVRSMARVMEARGMTEIRRTGPPTPRDIKGTIVTWTVPINATPPKAWLEYFVRTKDRSILCTPEHVRFYLGTMIFDSAEADVRNWIEFIEKWVASANQRYAEQLRQEQAVREAEAVDPAQRLRDLEERFKNL